MWERLTLRQRRHVLVGAAYNAVWLTLTAATGQFLQAFFWTAMIAAPVLGIAAMVRVLTAR